MSAAFDGIGRRAPFPTSRPPPHERELMLRFVIGRLLILIPTFLGVTVVAFLFIRLLPGDPVLLLAGERGVAPEVHARLMHELGLDEPLYLQYLHFLNNLLHGDFGMSLVTRRPVLDSFLTLFPATVELSLCAILLAIGIGIPVGVLSAVKRGSWLDQGLMGVALVGYSMPIFWWGAAADHRQFRRSGLDAGFGAHLADVFLQAGYRISADRQPAVGAEKGLFCPHCIT